MGRFLAVAIPTGILVENRKGIMASPHRVDVNKDKEAILEKINKYVDLSFYKTYIEEPKTIEKSQTKDENQNYDYDYDEEDDDDDNDGYIYLQLDEDKANKYLKELIEELHPLLNLDGYLFEFLYEKERKELPEDYNIQIKKLSEEGAQKIKSGYLTGKKKGTLYIEGTSEEDLIVEESVIYFGAPWLFDYGSDERRNIKVTIKGLTLWMDEDKIFSEDETRLLMILNTLSKSYFKSPLSKSMIFYITE